MPDAAIGDDRYIKLAGVCAQYSEPCARPTAIMFR